MDYCSYFKDKKITVMGLGLLGRGLGDTQFLAECGADLIVTDLKSEEELKTSLEELKSYDISYDLGQHSLESFRGRDMILKSAGVPINSQYIKEAIKNNIPVKMSASLVKELSPATVVGVTGSRGKSTVTQLIYHILKSAGKKVHLAGNVRGIATLPVLKEAKEGDIIVMELDSWQLQGFGDAQISPHVAVFTTFFPDHMNYYNNDMKAYFDDKANIYEYQKESDNLVVTRQSMEAIEKYADIKPQKPIVAEPIETENSILLGVHNELNVGCAEKVADILGIPSREINESIQTFSGVEGRLQFVKKVQGVRIYNDNNATTPDATIAALTALGQDKNIVLILGGTDKGLDMNMLVNEIEKHCKSAVLLKGTGINKLQIAHIGIKTNITASLKEAVGEAMNAASEGDIVLFSPAFASFGMFKNEYDRNDQFMEIVNNL